MFNNEIYLNRRKEFFKKIQKNSLVIIPASTLKVKSLDIHFPFRQNNNFYYLTGFNEPDAVLILDIKDSVNDAKSILLCTPKNPETEQWTGYIAGPEKAKEEYLFDMTYSLEETNSVLFEHMKNKKNIYFSFGNDNKLDSVVMSLINDLKIQIRNGIKVPDNFISYDDILSEMRLFKSGHEIEIIQRAVDITVKAHIKAISKAVQYNNERQLYAEILREFYFNGASSEAYPSIVASGKNSCILHYIDNNKDFSKEDIILIDAGCEVDNYASDITRTFPASGKFTQEQLSIYQLVLESQLAGIEQARPGVTYDKIQTAILDVLVDGLINLNILKGNKKDIINKGLYKSFYMHKSGHYLGLDTHDVGSYMESGKWRKLEPGMVITIEPGLYFSKILKNIDNKWHNIGVRIEDDILITKNGHKVLSNNLPKKVEDIYNLM